MFLNFASESSSQRSSFEYIGFTTFPALADRMTKLLHIKYEILLHIKLGLQ